MGGDSTLNNYGNLICRDLVRLDEIFKNKIKTLKEF